jgi:O-antigen ligase
MNKTNTLLRCIDALSWVGLLVVAAFSLVDYLMRSTGIPAMLAAGWDEVLLLGLFLLWGVRMLLNRQWEFRSSPVTLPLTVMLGLALLSVVVNRVPAPLGAEAIRVLLQGSLFYLVGYNLIRSRTQIQILVVVMLIAVTIIATYGIYQFATGLETPDRWVFGEAESGIRTRVFSTVGNPNALGGYLILFAPVALALALKIPNWPKRLACLAIFVIVSLCLVLTFSRGAWLGFIVSLIVLGVVLDRRILLMLLAGLLAAPFILPRSIIERIMVLFSAEYLRISAVWGRIYFWRQAWDRMIRNPWLGVGPGTFGDAVARRHNIPGSIWVDNHYLKIGAEIGVSGLLTFLWLMWVSVLGTHREWRRQADPFQKALFAGGAAGLIAVLVQNLTVSVFEVLFVSTYWWFIAGIMFAMAHLNWQAPARRHPEKQEG